MLVEGRGKQDVSREGGANWMLVEGGVANRLLVEGRGKHTVRGEGQIFC